MSGSGVTVVTPTIAPRGGMLRRAKESVAAQLLPADAHVIEHDVAREGAAATRNRGLMRVETDWVAFLDDDDHLLPGHLARLMAHAADTGADYVYSWYTVEGGTDPMPGNFGVPFDPAAPVQTTITVLVRAELAKSVGFGGDPVGDPNGTGMVVLGEDHRFTIGCVEAGARIEHLPERTWVWRHHGGNTSGMPDRW